MQDNGLHNKVALITGGARRIGAEIARRLHEHGMMLAIHYRSSDRDARALQSSLNERRPDSVILARGDLLEPVSVGAVVERTVAGFGRLDVVVNNASTFYPTPIGQATDEQWNDLVGTNMKAPFFLAQAAAPELRRSGGCIVNIADIYGQHPLANHAIYCAAKAGLIMLTRSLARDLAPEVRVNAVAPGAILWPERRIGETQRKDILRRTPLHRMGNPAEIARSVVFLIRDATYTSGHVLPIDGGRSMLR